MYQLSHMLTEQKTIMNNMMEMSITSDRTDGPVDQDPKDEDNTKKNLAFLLEKVEGCSSITDVPGRYLVHNGDLVELEPESFTQIQKVHAFLLNDSLMIASCLQHRNGPGKYKFQTIYELDGFAIVNQRDIGPVKNAFKILMFPDTRMYQCENPKEKRNWLDILESTKRKKAELDTQKRESSISQDRNSSISFNDSPFGEEDELEYQLNVAMETELLNVSWLQDLPEDLDVCMAQRDFEGAVDLHERVNEYLEGAPRSLALKEIQSRIDTRINQLTDMLVAELTVSPERSLRGGPRAARRAVTQLIRLGKSALACDLFLQNRSAITKYNIRQLKIEGATTLYIKRLCGVFFTSLKDTGTEFLKAFPDNYGCYSAFVAWAKEEIKMFMDLFKRQVFSSKAGLTVVADCVNVVRKHCDQLSDIGLEMTFTLNSLLLVDLDRTVRENKDYILDTVKHRANEDQWRPLNLKNTKAVKTFIDEMSELGVDDISKYVYDECWVSLSHNTTQFSKTYLTFLDDVLKLHVPELHNMISEALVDIFKAQLRHIELSLAGGKFISEHQFILVNTEFLLNSLLKVAEKSYQTRLGQPAIHLAPLHRALKKLKSVSRSVVGDLV